MEKTKTIKITKTLHSRLEKDKELLSQKKGMNYSFNAMILELYNIKDNKRK